MIQVNGNDAEPGCYIAGHHGQYALDWLAELCEDFGLTVSEVDDPRHWRRAADAYDEGRYDDMAYASDSGTPRAVPSERCWECHVDAADALLEQLNDVTTGGYFTWQDGELFLVQTEVTGVIYIASCTDEGDPVDYDEAWATLVENGPDIGRLGYDDLPSGETFYEFRITVHYEPEE